MEVRLRRSSSARRARAARADGRPMFESGWIGGPNVLEVLDVRDVRDVRDARDVLEARAKLAPSSRRARAELAPVVLVVGSEGLVEVGLSLFHPTSRRPSSIHTSTTPTTQVTTIFHQG